MGDIVTRLEGMEKVALFFIGGFFGCIKPELELFIHPLILFECRGKSLFRPSYAINVEYAVFSCKPESIHTDFPSDDVVVDFILAKEVWAEESG